MNKNFTILFLLVFVSQLANAQTKSPKRGLAYGGNSAADMQVLSPGISWWYNWSPTPDAGAADVYKADSVSFVPMVWGGNPNADQVVSQIPASGAGYLLGFNEPNFNAQSKLTPSQAAAMWPTIQDIARRKGLKIVSPAVNYCGDCVSEGGTTYNDPVQWLDDFFAKCKGCQVDYIAVHWYACDVLALQNYLFRFKKYNKPLWLTEFSCGDQDHSTITLATQQNYMQDAVHYLEYEPAVFHYAWFSGRNNEIPYINMLGNDGQLTSLGQAYVKAPYYVDQPNYRLFEAETYYTMSGVQTQLTTDVGGGINVGYNDPGDWMSYPNITVHKSGYYLMQYRVSSLSGGGKFTIDTSATPLATLNVASTGDWQQWTTITDTIHLLAGTHNFRISTIAAGYNLNWFSYTLIKTDDGSDPGDTGNGSNPGNGGTDPGNGSNPGNGGTDPGNGSNPGNGGTDPGNGSNPGTGNDGNGSTADKLDLYPNPTTSQLTFAAKYDLSGSVIHIYDMAGRLLSEIRPASNTIDVSRLSAGVYNLVLITNGKKITRQFVKN